jgi:hypothetical protein
MAAVEAGGGGGGGGTHNYNSIALGGRGGVVRSSVVASSLSFSLFLSRASAQCDGLRAAASSDAAPSALSRARLNSLLTRARVEQKV